MKKYKITTRKARGQTLTLNERYERYKKQFDRRINSLLKQGIVPKIYELQGDNAVLTFEEFAQAYGEMRKENFSATNAVRQLISDQLYGLSFGEALSLQRELVELGVEADEEVGETWSIRRLRSDLKSTALSKLNQALKDEGITNSYERRAIISERIFGSP